MTQTSPPKPKEKTEEQDISLNWLQILKLRWQKIRVIVEPLLLASAVSCFFEWLQVPVAWLIGSMLAGIAYAVIKRQSSPLPNSWLSTGKIIIAISAASRFSPETLGLAGNYALPLICGICTTGSLCMINGYLFSRWAGVDRATSLLGFVPGTASIVVAMSEELGADAASVTVLQYSRMILVVLLVPVAVSYLAPNLSLIQGEIVSPTLPNQIVPHVAAGEVPALVNLLVLAACGTVGTVLGKWLKLPTGDFLGTFLIAVCVFWVSPYPLYLPSIVFTIGLLLIGLSAGLKFDWETMVKLGKAVLLEICLVIFLVLCCFAVGYQFHQITHVDLTTALLAFAPGGMEAMIATANHLGGDTGLVLAIKLTRQLLIIIAINLLGFYMNLKKRASKF